MILRAPVTACRAAAPWPADAQVEQDLVMSRTLVALYQRKKGRDLFDLWQALSLLQVDDGIVLAMSGEYLHREGKITRAQFERNLVQKEGMPEFLGDILPLLPSGSGCDPAEALGLVRARLVEELPGRAWRAPDQGEP